MTSRVQRTLWFRPELCAVALAVAGWAILIAMVVGGSTLLAGSAGIPGLGALLAHCAVMSAAMMAPLVTRQVHDVAVGSLWRRRYRAVALFLLGYLGLWTLVSTGILTGAAYLAGAGAGSGGLAGAGGYGGLATWPNMTIVAFTAAVVACLLPGRRRLLRQCHERVPLALHGWPADRDSLRFGLVTGRRCVATCWPLMAAAMLSHGLLVMAAAGGVALAERRRPDLRPGQAALAVTSIAVIAMLLPVLLPGIDGHLRAVTPSGVTAPGPHAH